MNKLYFGDNLDVLREYVSDESVDLIYLDPPFNSQAQYNVFFQSPKEDESGAQAGAFRDTWLWGHEAEWAYAEIMRGGGNAAHLVGALRSALHESNMMAYLVMMAVRLRELRLKLKPSGALYLHCDATASHYLKILLDGIFGPEAFRSEIIWRRSGSHNSVTKQFGPIHDTLLFYAKSHEHRLRPFYTPHNAAYIRGEFRYEDARGAYRLNEIMAPQTRNGDSGRPWRGYDPTTKGRHWAIPESLKVLLPGRGAGMTTQEQLDALHGLGEIYVSPAGRPKYKQRPTQGVGLQDIWSFQPGTEGTLYNSSDEIDKDVKWLTNEQEKIGYPTQKPIGLLNRIIRSSSDEGQVILDPFCGCGTSIEAAQRSNRQWIGIDIAVHAIKVIESRLYERLGPKLAYDIEGMPRDFESAVKLADRDKYQFQWWANYLFNPHALRELKKGADRGIDGELFFPNGPGRPWGRMLTSVKGGHTSPNDVRAFARVLDRESAQLGLFICLRAPTREMLREAASVGLADVVHGDIPVLQIVAIEEWFKGKHPLLPPLEHLPSAAFAGRRRAVKPARPDPSQPQLPFSFGGIPSDGIVRHLNPRTVKGALSAAG